MSEESSMNFWYPLIKNLNIPMPKTEIPVTKSFWAWVGILDEIDPLSEEDKQAIRDAAVKVGGYPVFMRSDYCSGKHDFERTCYVKDEKHVISQIWGLVEDNCCKDLMMESIIIREYIQPASKFKAFSGLPIAPERRYFVRDGDVVCHHPYWPEDAILFWQSTKPEPKGWQVKLAEMNSESEEEIILLSGYAEQIVQVLGDKWSIDFMLGRDGIWYMIDMALAEQSFHPPCKLWEEKNK